MCQRKFFYIEGVHKRDFDLGHILIFIVPCAFHTALYIHILLGRQIWCRPRGPQPSTRTPRFHAVSRGSCWWAERINKGCRKKSHHASDKRRISHSLSRRRFQNSHPLGDSGGYTFGINDAAHTKAQNRFRVLLLAGRCVFSPLSAAAVEKCSIKGSRKYSSSDATWAADMTLILFNIQARRGYPNL